MSLSYLGIRNDLTMLLDKHVDDKLRPGFTRAYLHTYIYTSDRKTPEIFQDGENYGWYIRYPGYTCANIVFNKDDEVIDFKFIRIPNCFGTGKDTIFDDPDELEKLILEKFKGKKITYDLEQED